MAKLADASGLGPDIRKDMRVQVSLPAPQKIPRRIGGFLLHLIKAATGFGDSLAHAYRVFFGVCIQFTEQALGFGAGFLLALKGVHLALKLAFLFAKETLHVIGWCLSQPAL